MRTYLPLNALRAFESAARHLSFTRAAAELCVTPTAISHQVRSLEDFLDAPLFERKHGRLTLTSAAAEALSDLSEGFNKLESALSPLTRRGGHQKIVVATSPSVASLWLLPRLARFVEAAGDIDVSIATMATPAAFLDAAFDIAIMPQEQHPNRKVEFLMDEQIMPVCAPTLLARFGHDGRRALASLPLIHDDKACERFPTWRRYLEEAGVTDRDTLAGLRFDQSSMAVDAAERGHGMLLGRSRLIGKALLDRRLTALAPAFSLRRNYYTVRAHGLVAKPVKLFLDWLGAEVAREATARAPAAAPQPAPAEWMAPARRSARERVRVAV